MTLFKLSYCKSLFYILITILLFSKCTWDNEEEKLTKGGNNNTTDTTLFSKSLIAFFTFEESFTDSSKNELLLKTEGNPTFAKTGYSSTSNSSLYLDGQSSIKLFIGTYDTLTLCMWIKSFSQLNNINNNESPTIINYSNGKFNLSIDGITGQTHPVIKTQNKELYIEDVINSYKSWNFLSIQFIKNKEVNISYWNKDDGEFKWNIQDNALSFDNGNLIIGKSSDPNKPSFKGYIDNLLIYNRLLNDNEIVHLRTVN